MENKKIFSFLGIILIIYMLVANLVQILWVKGIPLLIGTENSFIDSSWNLWLGMLIPMYFIATPVAFFFFRRIPAERLAENRLGGKGFFQFLLMCFPVMYVGSIIGNVLSMIISSGNSENILVDLVLDSNPLRYVVIVVAAPIFEEFVFRKLIIDRTRKYGEKIAIFFSAFTFALFHMNLYQFFYTFGIGLIFAYVYVRTGRLRYPIILHAIINIMGSVVAPWIVSLAEIDVGGSTEITGGMTESALIGLMVLGIYGLIMIALSIAGIVVIALKAGKLRLLPTNQQLEKGKKFKTVYLNVGMILFIIVSLFFTFYTLF